MLKLVTTSCLVRIGQNVVQQILYVAGHIAAEILYGLPCLSYRHRAPIDSGIRSLSYCVSVWVQLSLSVLYIIVQGQLDTNVRWLVAIS